MQSSLIAIELNMVYYFYIDEEILSAMYTDKS